jgi:(p)ppGpp synthase/HD superfamily hydrolase
VPNDESEVELSFLRDLPLASQAAEFAASQHRGQRREGDQAIFLAHPLEVASLLARSGYPDQVIAAALLHDVLEDTDVSDEAIGERFGDEVQELVAAVSDDPGIHDEDERKAELRERVRNLGGYAAVVYAADKISKVRELRMVIARGGRDEQVTRKLERHRESLEMLVDISPDARLVELLRFELESLDSLPPQPDGA